MMLKYNALEDGTMEFSGPRSVAGATRRKGNGSARVRVGT
jgi:hypothetical protein